MIRIKILYATQTGIAESCAEHLFECLQEQGFEAEVTNVADFELMHLRKSDIALLILASWGEGEPPREAVGFYDELRELEADLLAHLRFAVVALGDRESAYFCSFGREVDHLMAQAGATRLCERLDCDLDHDERLSTWIKSVLEQMGKLPAVAATN